MKRVVVSIVIIGIIALSWLMYFKNIISNNIEYSKAMDKANNYYSRKLYDPAIENYKKALSIKSTKECSLKMLDAYKKRSENIDVYGTNANQEYIDELKDVFSEYKDEESIAIDLSDALIVDDNYEEAYDVLCESYDDSHSSKVKKKIDKLKYMNHFENVKVVDFKPFYGGKSSATDGMKWATIESDATVGSGFENSFQNQSNKAGCILIGKEKEAFLYDGEQKVLGRFSGKIEDASMYSNNRIAIKNNGKYSVYDKTGKKLFGQYDNISTFQDEKAAVLQSGKWSIIDENGEVEDKTDFDDIVFDNGGHYLNDGVIVASKGKKYSLFNDSFKQIIDENYDAIDKATSDKIYAFKKDGKWGFIDDDGEVVIKPEYEEAKSFSNGLAAVCKNSKWGFIDKNNKMVIKNKYEGGDYFTKEGTCFVKEGDPYEKDGYSWKLLKLEIGIPKNK